jgi:N utilization substance protein A
MTALTAPTTPLTVLAGVGPKTIEKIEAAGIANLEKLASMTPEQLMEIPGIGEKMVDKIYQAVNRFYEGGEAAATPVETTDENGEETPAAESATETGAEASDESPAEAASETETSATTESASEANSEAAASTEAGTPAEQQEEKSS